MPTPSEILVAVSVDPAAAYADRYDELAHILVSTQNTADQIQAEVETYVAVLQTHSCLDLSASLPAANQFD